MEIKSLERESEERVDDSDEDEDFDEEDQEYEKNLQKRRAHRTVQGESAYLVRSATLELLPLSKDY